MPSYFKFCLVCKMKTHMLFNPIIRTSFEVQGDHDGYDDEKDNSRDDCPDYGGCAGPLVYWVRPRVNQTRHLK